ncbi:hypothetical protein Acid345_1086 [Candidatus Koribacter versatilis Ellin345]|uniref:Uncharacterized protein n=1 Tax=Koribacter versatilis (strain Ellin345) TaxID=204669 RepID=Q1ISR1_KORVE|nr:hypothetical protein [Candidatus Koribacter versatilis]ABF40089.1 hypothetical protein Acid345_1086 [Candidatus Koribacter versatilis Ellin345]
MTHQRHSILHWIVFLLFCAIVPTAIAADELKTIDNPGGGQVVYGSLTGQNSPSAAMGFMLKQVHGHFGDRPQIGKFFQARGSDSIAVFFNLTAKNQGNKPIAGMVIVSMPPGGTTTAAVLYDDAGRFAKTEPEMMKALNAAWLSARSERSAGAAPSVQPLSTATAGDRSASIGLPVGWQLTQVAGGSIRAEGPNGEAVFLGMLFQGISDPSNVQRAYGAGPHLVASFSGDLFSAYAAIMNQMRQSRGLPAATFSLLQETPVNAPGEGRVVLAMMDLDLHDGKGPRTGSVRLGAVHVPGTPTWALSVNGSQAPKTVAAQLAPTIKAMVASYRQNGAVVSAEQQAAMSRVQADAAAAAAQGKALDARREASNASFDNHMRSLDQSNASFNGHMDDLDRSSKAFQNYQLDRSVVHDNDYAERGTVSNSYADSLVRANPDRFQIIQNQDLIKGIDY